MCRKYIVYMMYIVGTCTLRAYVHRPLGYCGQMYVVGKRTSNILGTCTYTLQANVYFGQYTNLHVLWVSENSFTIRICIPSFFFQPKRSFRCYCFYPTRYFTEIIFIIFTAAILGANNNLLCKPTVNSVGDRNIRSSKLRDKPLQMINFVSVLSAAKLRMISEGLVHKYLYAVSATSFGFAGFYDGVQLTNLVFLNSERHNYPAVEDFN